MKFTSLLASALAVAVMSVTAAAAEVADTCVRCYRWVETKIANAFDAVLKVGAADSTTDAKVVGFVQAKAFVLRLIKRELIQVEQSFRLCPSI